MSGIHTTLVTSAHDYTRSDEPWRLDADTSACGVTSHGKRFGWRLFHYLAGGGMKAFGRSVRQEERERRQNRFFAAMGVVAVLWLVLWLA